MPSPTWLLLLAFVVHSDAVTTLYQNMTVFEGQPVGTVIGEVGSGQVAGWLPDAGPPYEIYMTDTTGVNVTSSGLVIVAGPLSRQLKSVYQFVAVSAKHINIVVSIFAEFGDIVS